MSSKFFKLHILLFLLSLIALADLGMVTQTIVRDDELIASHEELDDLKKSNSILNDSTADKPAETRFSHRDEDMLADLKQSTIFANLKSDVEILESSEVKKEDVELEERYRAPAIILNTDNFINENIEVNADKIDLEERVAADNALAASHFILVMVLTAVALVAIGLFVALIVWRNYTQHRYGMRELLVTSDNQDYWPQDVITSVVAQQRQQYQEQQQQQHQEQF